MLQGHVMLESWNWWGWKRPQSPNIYPATTMFTSEPRSQMPHPHLFFNISMDIDWHWLQGGKYSALSGLIQLPFYFTARSVDEQTAVMVLCHFGQETSEIWMVSVAISSHPPAVLGLQRAPSTAPLCCFFSAHGSLLLLLPVALGAASPDTSGPIRTCPPARIFPALLQIIHSWALFCLASLASVFISHRGNWACLGSTNAFIATEIKTPPLDRASQGKICLWILLCGASLCGSCSPCRVMWAVATAAATGN